MKKCKSNRKLFTKNMKLPQAGIIYAIQSQDIVAIGPIPTNSKSKLQKYNSNNNKIIKKQYSENSWNCTESEDASISISSTGTNKTNKESNSTFSSENFMQHLFIDHKNVNNNKMTFKEISKNQNSLVVHRGSLVSEETSRGYTDPLSKSLIREMDPYLTTHEDLETEKSEKKREKSRKKKKSTDKYKNTSGKVEKSLKHKSLETWKAPNGLSSTTDKRTKIIIKPKESFSNTDTQVSTRLFESKHYNNIKSSQKDKCSEQSDSSVELYQERGDSDLMCRYQNQSIELSKLKVKFNELSLENSTVRQMLENVTMEVNNLRYENSSVKTRNETLAARSLENQNLSRIIDCLNKKIKDLCQEIENCQIQESEKSRKLLELSKCLQDSQEKESSITVELEHLKDQLLQKEMEYKKLAHHQKVDEAKDFQIKMIHNELIELKGNIRVLCRVKPETNNCIQILGNETLQLPPIKSKMVCPIFNFNRVFRPNSSQIDIFSEVRQLVNSFVDGYNVSLITYGQSCSGKTHTMLGTKEDPGIVTHSIREIFKLCKQRSTWTYKICLSVLEIYNETIFDLLSTDNSIKPLWKKRTQIHDDGKCIHIKGLSEIEIQNEEELLHFITRSGKGRSSCITSQNNDSSRSHFIVMLRIYGKNSFQNCYSQGVLMLCDLAGSENCSSTLCNNSLTESKYISKSLTVLGRVFEALFNKLTVIPFRDSKLTHILKPSLSGDAKFAFIVTVSGKMENINNSLRVLNLAKKVAQISLGQPRKNTHSISKPVTRVELMCQTGP